MTALLNGGRRNRSAGRPHATRDLFLPAVGVGLILMGLFLVIHGLSDRFVYGSDMARRPIGLFVVVLMLAGAAYVAVVTLATRRTSGEWTMAWILAAGLFLRVVMATANPILEDDFYRYLWDGAVVAHGHDPYGWLPEAVRLEAREVPRALVALGEASGIVLTRVNHPELGTVYPPLVMAVFGVAHMLTPWSTGGLKILYFIFDTATLVLILGLLRRLNRPSSWAIAYWWNPLFIKETYNSVHMDVLLLPLLLGAVALALSRRPYAAGASLSGAIAVKLWPALLAPALIFSAGRRHGERLTAAFLLAMCVAVLLFPALSALRHGQDSGFIAYGQRWEMNDALFMVFPWFVERVASLVGEDLSMMHAHLAGKGLAAAVLVVVTMTSLAWMRREPRHGSPRLPDVALWTVAALFLVSPTQFPWYATWFLPFLALRPSFGLLLLTVMLPLYYLRFHLDALGQEDFFHYRLVWLEYAPVWLALIVGGWCAWRRRTAV